ncbi:hypothetical protein [Sulfurimonas sp.]
MCFGGGDSSSNASGETFNRAFDIYIRFRYNSRITSDKYIDPLGYEYNRSSQVSCSSCIFSFGGSKCIIYKENGWSDSNINSKMSDVYKEKYCDYFLIKNFSEGDDEDEIAQKAAKEIKEKLYS